ncbi:MAG: RNase adapter RapZ [Tissierellia bacterium]|nr:RNase adapter RapZ [Tissierellia bacterium]
MDLVIITGMSGAGKTAVLNLCQDKDYYTLDNLPPSLIKDVIRLLEGAKIKKTKLALVIDIRGGEFFKDLYEEIDRLKKEEDHDLKLIFIDASDDVILKRYKELRRPHPQGKGLTLLQAIKSERQELSKLRDMADYYVDTTHFNLPKLQYNIGKILGHDSRFLLQFVSFGFKNGILKEADFVFDVRFTPNPFYIADLKDLNGQDKKVRDFVMADDRVGQFIQRVEDMLLSLSPDFERLGKSSLMVGIGCTGGKHRSVAIAEELNRRFLEKNINSEIYHRDQNMW